MTVKLQPLLKLLNEGASQREISRQLDISRTSVKSYMDRFTASGMSNTRTATLRWYFIESLTREELESLLTLNFRSVNS